MKAKERQPFDPGVVVATIPRGKASELRVAVKTWKGRRLVDVRVWFKKEGADDVAGRGIVVDSAQLDALITGLGTARQHA